ncbi:MAG: hypothetical protein AAFN91_00315 [Pseudomonadota bacterium]
MNQETKVLMARVAKLGEISESEAHRIINEIYKDGIVSRAEAESLFRLNDMLSAMDPAWISRFQEAMKDYLLTREPPEGWITDGEADWLIAQVQNDAHIPSLDELDLLIELLRKADGAPEKLARFTVEAVSDRIISDGIASLNMVERMRYALYAGAGHGGLWVSQFEAGLLFKTNDAIAEADNAPTWNDLFARAVGNHLMARAHPDPQTVEGALARESWLQDSSSSTGGFFSRMGASFSSGNWFEMITHNGRKAARARQTAAEAADREAEKVTEFENEWLLAGIGADGKVSPAETALIEFLKQEAPGFAQGLAVAV